MALSICRRERCGKHLRAKASKRTAAQPSGTIHDLVSTVALDPTLFPTVLYSAII
jgi:hypothetical protein